MKVADTDGNKFRVIAEHDDGTITVLTRTKQPSEALNYSEGYDRALADILAASMAADDAAEPTAE